MLNLFRHLYEIDSDLHQNDKRGDKGFTLVEMLMVIAIVGIISSVTIPSVLGFTEKGRDAKRKIALKQIQTALELYRQDAGTYPVNLPSCGQPFLIPPSSSILLASAVSDRVNYRHDVLLAQGFCWRNDQCGQGFVCKVYGGAGRCVPAPTNTPTPTPIPTITPTLTPSPIPTVTPTPTPTPIPAGYTRYLKETPCDPSTNNPYGYVSDGATYHLYGCIENAGDLQAQTLISPPQVGAQTGNLTCSKYYVLANPK